MNNLKKKPDEWGKKEKKKKTQRAIFWGCRNTRHVSRTATRNMSSRRDSPYAKNETKVFRAYTLQQCSVHGRLHFAGRIKLLLPGRISPLNPTTLPAAVLDAVSLSQSQLGPQILHFNACVEWNVYTLRGRHRFSPSFFSKLKNTPLHPDRKKRMESTRNKWNFWQALYITASGFWPKTRFNKSKGKRKKKKKMSREWKKKKKFYQKLAESLESRAKKSGLWL